MRRTLRTTLLAVFLASVCPGFGPACRGGGVQTVATDLPWSKRIADSFLLRHPENVTYDTGFTERKWNYEQGLMLWALHQMTLYTNDEKYDAFLEANLDQYVESDGTITTYRRDDYNLDLVAPGRALLVAYDRTKNEKYRIAAATLRQQLSEQPRTKEGGFWHKKIYPNQMWLDGLYMAEPFYAMYASRNNQSEAFDDIATQFALIAKHTRDATTGLYSHGWDESRNMPWADSVTGRSPSFWGRAIGWFAMGLVDVLDYFPKDHPRRHELVTILRDVCSGVLKWRDTKSKLWYLILDKPEQPGNYLESSSACMFTYAFAKAARAGYVGEEYRRAARESFDAIVKHHVTVDRNGFVNLHHTIKGAGLGGTPYRDGSFAYYTGEAQRTNDMKGLGPFLLAAMEIEKEERKNQ